MSEGGYENRFLWNNIGSEVIPRKKKKGKEKDTIKVKPEKLLKFLLVS